MSINALTSLCALFQATSMIVTGLGLAVLGFGARYVMRTMPKLGEKMAEASKSMPRIDSQVNVFYAFKKFSRVWFYMMQPLVVMFIISLL